MSIWTNIAGIISAECNICNNDKRIESIKAMIEEGINIPEGSEGRLEYYVLKIGDPHDTNNTLISFWGNLRDYDDNKVCAEMLSCLRNLVKKFNNEKVRIRNMAIAINTRDILNKSFKYLLTVEDVETEDFSSSQKLKCIKEMINIPRL